MKKAIVILVPLLVAMLACGSTAPAPASDLRLTITAAAGQFGAGSTLLPAAPAETLAAQPPAAGQTRDNPLPGSQGVDIGNRILLTVQRVTRPANSVVTGGNMFNPTPPAGLEYMTVKIQVECAKSANEKCTFYPIEMKAVGADGQVHDSAFVIGVAEHMSDFNYEFFGGAKVTGLLVFLVPQNDSRVVLFHDPLFFGSPIYISLQ